MESRFMSLRKRGGGTAASTARRYAARVSRGVTPRFAIAISRTAATRSAISATVKPSGKMIRRRSSGGGAVVVGAAGRLAPAAAGGPPNAPSATTTRTATATPARVSRGSLQPALEEMRGRERVLGRATARLLGERRREPLVLGLDRDVEAAAQRIDERLRLARLLAVLAAQRQRQADDDELRLVLGDELGEAVEPRLASPRSRRRPRVARACPSRPRRPRRSARSRSRAP